jgi:hypothetical protein
VSPPTLRTRLLLELHGRVTCLKLDTVRSDGRLTTSRPASGGAHRAYAVNDQLAVRPTGDSTAVTR